MRALPRHSGGSPFGHDPAASDTLEFIANTAAQLTAMLDELREQEPDRHLAGPNPTRVTLDQAAAAAEDLRTLIARLTPNND